MRLVLTVATIPVLGLIIPKPGSAENEAKNPDQRRRVKRLAVFAPRPKYSRNWPEGSGIFRAYIDKVTGHVIRVEVIKSTGYKILDDSGVECFQHWRFKSGIASHVDIPLTFSHRQKFVPQ